MQFFERVAEVVSVPEGPWWAAGRVRLVECNAHCQLPNRGHSIPAGGPSTRSSRPERRCSPAGSSVMTRRLGRPRPLPLPRPPSTRRPVALPRPPLLPRPSPTPPALRRRLLGGAPQLAWASSSTRGCWPVGRCGCWASRSAMRLGASSRCAWPGRGTNSPCVACTCPAATQPASVLLWSSICVRLRLPSATWWWWAIGTGCRMWGWTASAAPPRPQASRRPSRPLHWGQRLEWRRGLCGWAGSGGSGQTTATPSLLRGLPLPAPAWWTSSAAATLGALRLPTTAARRLPAWTASMPLPAWCRMWRAAASTQPLPLTTAQCSCTCGPGGLGALGLASLQRFGAVCDCTTAQTRCWRRR